MTAVGSRDGREIVRTLEALRAREALDRDGEGRYFIKSGAKGCRRPIRSPELAATSPGGLRP